MSYQRQSRPWRETDLDQIETLLKQGLNPRQIAAINGRTRNAVIGMIHRHPTLKQAMKEKGRTMTTPPKPPSPKLKAAEYDARALKLPMMALKEDQCRYIAGGDYLFCGWPVEEGSRYCQHHARRCMALPRSKA